MRFNFALALAVLAVAAAAAARPAAAATAGRLPEPCSGALLSDFDSDALPSLRNAFTMALLSSDAYPATLLPHASNAKYNTLVYQDTLRRRWAALGARSVEVVDDFEDNLEAHALVAASASDVFIAFRGTSTTEGWTSNVRIAPWKLASGSGAEGAPGGGLQVHSGFLASFAAVYPRVAKEVAKAMEHTVDNPGAARVFISGHSLGGAHAMLAALALADSGAKIGGVWTFAAPKAGKGDFVEAYMRRFGDVTFRWVNGLDIVPTLPPDLPGMAEPFRQLPADSTLWRTLNGRCVKASGPLLLDCPPASEAAPAEEEDAGKDGKRGKRRTKGREERCSFVMADHRLYKALASLGRCVAAEAEAAGDLCTQQLVASYMPAKSDDEGQRG
ncbi:lipase [Raphidocelis subcapitata]|uniref:Lipase n=1 Tax=Raphidocelis subcapitata TaxID=307507 RepID=A0A2V0P6S7_9CHLO|nr:lipase [Raphidocelis subcapitata]|eukprot:GBF95574.1 lipase [Raphidocelis subcapitata]